MSWAGVAIVLGLLAVATQAWWLALPIGLALAFLWRRS